MNQRVSITYSVELDQIPKKVGELIDEAGARLLKLSDRIDRVSTSLKAGHSALHEELERVDGIRRSLSEIDINLLDSAEILHGYQRTLVQLREQEIAPTAPAVEEQNAPEELKEIIDEAQLQAQLHLRDIKKEQRYGIETGMPIVEDG